MNVALFVTSLLALKHLNNATNSMYNFFLTFYILQNSWTCWKLDVEQIRAFKKRHVVHISYT